MIVLGGPPTSDSPSRRRIDPADVAQLRRLYGFTRPYRVALVVALVAALASSALGLVFPAVVGQLVDAAFLYEGAAGTQALDQAVILLLFVALVQGLFSSLRTYLMALIGDSVVADLRRKVYAHLLLLPLRFFEQRKIGDITSRLTSDVATVQAMVSTAISQALSQGLLLVGGVTILFVTNLRLALVMVSVVPVVVLASAYFGRRLRRVGREFQDRVADANAGATEAIGGVRVVQSFTAEADESARYARLVEDSLDVARRRARLRAGFQPSVGFTAFGGIGLVLWYGGRLVLAGEMTTGSLIAFLLYTVGVAAAIGQFTGLYGQFQEALGASARIFGLLDERSDLAEPRSPVALTRERVKGRVTFEDVSFRYGTSGAPGEQRETEDVLRDISLEGAPGEVIALVGPSGAGKTTLVNLVPRFYDPTAGRILLDGVDLRSLALRALRSHVGMVPQETHLFSGTIRENILYGRPGATDAELRAAARAANAEEFIGSFVEGLETIVGERGVKLSGGQRQRIAIARALLKDPRILILDEATSSLDSASEALVQEALERLMQGRTTFVIAHRLSTVHHADRIVVLDDGRVVQQGSHEALLLQEGLYRDLYHRQFRRRAAAELVPAGSRAAVSEWAV